MANDGKNDDSFNINQNFQDCQSQNYDIVTFDIRVKLIKLVLGENYKISRAARVLNINESTAKYIVRTFRKKGKILMKVKNKTMDKEIIKELQELQKKQYVQNLSLELKKGKNKKNCEANRKLKELSQEKIQKEMTLIFNQRQQNNLEAGKELSKDSLPTLPGPLSLNPQIVLVPFYFDPFSQIAWTPIEHNTYF